MSFPVEILVNEKKCDFLNVFKHFNKMLGPTHIVQVTFNFFLVLCELDQLHGLHFQGNTR